MITLDLSLASAVYALALNLGQLTEQNCWETFWAEHCCEYVSCVLILLLYPEFSSDLLLSTRML